MSLQTMDTLMEHRLFRHLLYAILKHDINEKWMEQSGGQEPGLTKKMLHTPLCVPYVRMS